MRSEKAKRTDALLSKLHELRDDDPHGFAGKSGTTKEGDQYRGDLSCCVESMSYDFKRQSGMLFIKARNCCDMTGCIHLFQAIDKHVKAIYTYSGDSPDTCYFKINGKWHARCCRSLLAEKTGVLAETHPVVIRTGLMHGRT